MGYLGAFGEMVADMRRGTAEQRLGDDEAGTRGGG